MGQTTNNALVYSTNSIRLVAKSDATHRDETVCRNYENSIDTRRSISKMDECEAASRLTICLEPLCSPASS